MISLRREIEVSDQVATRLKALLKVFLGLTGALPKTVLPADPGMSEVCRDNLERATVAFQSADIPVSVIEAAGRTCVDQVEAICAANKAAIDERDAALKEVVATVADAVSGFKGQGEKHKSALTQLADGFSELSHVEDVNLLRRKLREEVAKLHQCAEQIRRESDETARRFETQISSFRQRLEMARTDSSIDRLTGLGSRREADWHLARLGEEKGQVTVLLYSVEGLQEVNDRFGPLFGDKLLRAFALLLHERYSQEDHVYRWGAHEFLAVVLGSTPIALELARHTCRTFFTTRYQTAELGPDMSLRARVDVSAASFKRGESVEELLRRARQGLQSVAARETGEENSGVR
ncbi:MAG: diguanylate cyclase domain-containing protein [Bryobacteraceae bacterium]